MSRKNRVAHVSDLGPSDVALRVARDILDAPEPLPRFAETPGPAAHGHVMWFDGENYRRCPVRVPLELLSELSSGPTSPPDHRSTHVAHVARELMTDALLSKLHEDKETR